jgi:hypothetical protein
MARYVMEDEVVAPVDVVAPRPTQEEVAAYNAENPRYVMEDAPAPKSSLLDRVLRQAGLTARYAVEGVTALPAMAGTALGGLYNGAADAMQSPTQESLITGEKGFRFPDQSQAISEGLTALGLPQPENATERVIGDMSRASFGAGGIVGAGKAASGYIGKVLADSPFMQELAAAGSGGAMGITREMGGDADAQNLAALAGAFAPSVPAIVGGVVKGMARGGEAGRNALINRVQTLSDAGIEKPSVGLATGNRGIQALESGLARLPGGSGPMVKSGTKVQEDMGRKIGDLADSVMPNATSTKAGLTIERGIKHFVQRFRAEQNRLYDKLDQFIKPDTQVPAINVLAQIKDLTKPIQGAEQTSALIQTPRMEAIGEALKADATAKGAQPTFTAIPQPGAVKGGHHQAASPLTYLLGPDGKPIVTGQTLASPAGIPYKAIKELRTAIGAKLANPSLTDDIPTSQWKRLYGALSSDMEEVAKAAGPDAEKAFARANSYTKAGHDRIDGILERVSGREGGEKIYKAVMTPSEMKEGATTLNAVMRSLAPDERKPAVAVFLKNLGKATSTNQDDVGSVFSSQTLLTNWNNLSPEAKKTIAGASGDLEFMRNLSTVAKAANMAKEGSKVFSNPSGTAQAVSNGAAIGASLLRPDLLPAILIGAGGANLTAKMLTNPKVVKWLATATTKPEATLPVLLNQLAITSKNDPDLKQDVDNYITAVKSQAQKQ